jgi:hypothetical protein
VTSPRARRSSHSSTTRSTRRDLEQRALEQRLLLADLLESSATASRLSTGMSWIWLM